MQTDQLSRDWIAKRQRPDGHVVPTEAWSTRLRRKLTGIGRRSAAAVLSLAYRRYRGATKPTLEETRSVLIIPNAPIGDLILTSAMWQALRARRPDMRIGIGASAINRTVLEFEPDLTTYDLHSRSIVRLWHEMRRARRDGWDVVLAPAGFYKPVLFAFVSRCIARRGFTATMHISRPHRYARIYSLCGKRPAESERVPMLDQYVSLVEETFGIRIPSEGRSTHFTISPAVLESVAKRISELLHERGASAFILVNLEAKNAYREWGFANLRALAEKLASWRSDLLLIVIATKEYRSYYSRELAGLDLPNVVSFETESIHHAAALVVESALVITPDTSIVHIADALGKRIIAFYPFADEWLPRSPSGVILCPARWEPISTISVDTVYSQIRSVLAK